MSLCLRANVLSLHYRYTHLRCVFVCLDKSNDRNRAETPAAQAHESILSSPLTCNTSERDRVEPYFTELMEIPDEALSRIPLLLIVCQCEKNEINKGRADIFKGKQRNTKRHIKATMVMTDEDRCTFEDVPV